MIYLDHAATTPCRPEVAAAMAPYFTEKFGNPSSIHAAGQDARQALDDARDRVAAALGTRAEEIVFTGGGTEADNLALIGAFLVQRKRGKSHLITAATEHHAILHTADFLSELGAEVTVLPVDGDGLVDPDDVRRALRPETYLVSIMAANNEIGVIAPLAEIGAITREAGVLFHTDAVQGIGQIPMSLAEMGIDLLSLTAHKFYGPKGVGALYVRRGVRVQPLLHGGGQERDRRAGTSNVAGIVGLATALELALADLDEQAERLTAFRNDLIQAVEERISGVTLNGHRTRRLPNNANLSFEGVESDVLLLNLDLAGIAASSGSACTAGAVEPSHVLAALGGPRQRAVSAVRFTLGRATTAADLERTVDVLEGILRRVRA